MPENEAEGRGRDFHADLETMSAMDLRHTYPATAENHKAMMRRRVTEGAIVAPEFRKFRDFLRHVGPRPRPDLSIDRLDWANPTYGPGLVKWQTKRGQANNRRTTVWLELYGDRQPITVWAERTRQKPDTMRKRKRDGWSDREIIAGKQDTHDRTVFGIDPREFDPWPTLFPDMPEVQRDWEALYRKERRSISRIEFADLEITERRDAFLADLQGFDSAGPGHDQSYRDALLAELGHITPFQQLARKLRISWRRAVINYYPNGKPARNKDDDPLIDMDEW
ncbi:hypothetical protein [Brevundimonas aurifodinae]|uniref:Uncharacterized protein n=1 Tax=Brevundimonas aurifodinae TaxID=1508312 RepID=A0ABV1NSD2_9CAUL